MAIRLYYFDFNGLGESIRYILHHAQVEFEDVRLNHDTWPTIKADFPYGMVPVYEEGDSRINQSLAIARYLGHRHGLSAGDAWRDAELDAIALTFNDFWVDVKEYFKVQGEDQKQAVKKKLMDETLDVYFSRFEKTLKENNGVFGGKLSWVEFLAVGLIEAANKLLGESVEANYPAIKALIAHIHASPGVKKYVDSRKN